MNKQPISYKDDEALRENTPIKAVYKEKLSLFIQNAVLLAVYFML